VDIQIRRRAAPSRSLLSQLTTVARSCQAPKIAQKSENN